MDNSIPDSTPQKQCFKCQQWFPATSTYFTKHPQKKDGWNPSCKACKNGKPLVIKEPVPEGKKRCSKCETVYDATSDNFAMSKNSSDGLHGNCKVCVNAYAQIYNDSHKEEHAQYRQEHKEEIKERNQAYYAAEHGRLMNRTAWHRYKNRKRATPGTLTAEQIRAKLKSQKYKCYYSACGHAKFAKVNGKYIYHLEHTIPISRTELGPRHDPDYTVLACPSCNLSKGGKAPWEWSEGGRLF